MKLVELAPPERGSLAAVYCCPKCSARFAMLTNPFETQVVGSLGVNIGPAGEQIEGESKCPFSSMVQEAGAGTEASSADLTWSSEASSRLARIPEFARPLARAGIERFAREHGLGQVDVGVLDRARDSLET
jgi:hypothetical protein